MTFSTEINPIQNFAKTENSDASGKTQMPNLTFEYILRNTRKSEFCNLLHIGGVILTMENVIDPTTLSADKRNSDISRDSVKRDKRVTLLFFFVETQP